MLIIKRVIDKSRTVELWKKSRKKVPLEGQLLASSLTFLFLSIFHCHLDLLSRPQCSRVGLDQIPEYSKLVTKGLVTC